jgi:hypothetical protein
MNQKAISQASERYDKEVKKDYLLKPISKEDINIIKELTELCKKANIKGVKETMDNYKVNPDKEISEQLLEISSNFKVRKEKKIVPYIEDGDTETEEKNFYRMVKFCDSEQRRIYQPNIISYRKFYNEGSDEYGIFLNECDETLQRQPMHANTLLIYEEENVRDEDFKMLDEYFS